MLINIYTLTKSHQGYIPSDIVIGSVKWIGTEFDAECISGALKEKILSIFNSPINVRISKGKQDESFSFAYRKLQPSDPAFIPEIMCRLRKNNLWGELQ